MSLFSNPSLVLDQMSAFLEAFLQGGILAACFDFYKALRLQLFKRKKPALSVITDLLFWLFVTITFIITLILRRWGEIYLYTYAGLILGCTLYFYLLSNAFFPLFRKVLSFVSGVVERIFRLVSGVVVMASGPLSRLKKRINKRENQRSSHKRFWSRILEPFRRS